jgi:hypothetical protein
MPGDNADAQLRLRCGHKITLRLGSQEQAELV